MNLIPSGLTRLVAEQALNAQKHSPEILFGAGVVSMVGSTVLACRATLKLDEVLDSVEADKAKAEQAKEKVESGNVPEGTTYTDAEMARDLKIIKARGFNKIIRLYAPAVILGGVGLVLLTKSHMILKDRNVALTAAYVAVDTAFKQYRGRVVETYGEDVDREMRYGSEVVDIVDEETGKVVTTVVAGDDVPSQYARWFDMESSSSWNNSDIANKIFLRTQQNWANDQLRIRGHIFLNEVYSMIGLPHTSAGAVVGWLWNRNNENGDNYVDFGCWDQDQNLLPFFNGRDGAILLDFNVDGVIWDLIDRRNPKGDN